MKNKQSQNSNFYKQIQPFLNFEDLANESNYQSVPDSWFVVITDIKNSTSAIRQGRYKDVNIVGAACIANVHSVMPDDEYPYVFGGDGASFIIPQCHLKNVTEALQQTRKLAKDNFNLELRIGVVSIEALRKQGQIIKLGKFQLAKGKFIAKIKGGGISYADFLIKSDYEKYKVEESSTKSSSLTNLSCRWSPIKSSNGKILTLIIKAKKEESYPLILNEFKNILGSDSNQFNPVKIDSMNYMSLKQMLVNEIRFEPKKISFKAIARCLEIVFCSLIFGAKLFKKIKPLNEYANSMGDYSDFRKFDDALRMVLDCTPDQVNSIIYYLSQLQETSDGSFGYSIADEALMTCLVQSTSPGGHIHFIDGGNGGYVSAAIELKKQLKSAS